MPGFATSTASRCCSEPGRPVDRASAGRLQCPAGPSCQVATLSSERMTEPSRPPERIDLRRADDPRDVVHRAVACLAQGGVVGLPTETAYGLAASALHPEAV